MKVIVESWNPEFRHLIQKVRRTALKLGRLLGLKSAYVEIYLVGDSFMKKNVLSFPAPKNFPRPDIGKKYKHLGEIYLNPDYIRKEGSNFEFRLPAGQAGISDFPAKLSYMLIHGFLHLLGYDHVNKNDRIIMEKKENQLLKLSSN